MGTREAIKMCLSIFLFTHWLIIIFLYFIQKKDYHLSSQFRWKNGYAIPKDKLTGIGKAPLDVDCMLYSKTLGTTGSVFIFHSDCTFTL